MINIDGKHVNVACTKDIRIENAAFADALSGLAENFAYDKILALVQKAKETFTGKQVQ